MENKKYDDGRRRAPSSCVSYGASSGTRRGVPARQPEALYHPFRGR
jgi:hypothetical protein